VVIVFIVISKCVVDVRKLTLNLDENARVSCSLAPSRTGEKK